MFQHALTLVMLLGVSQAVRSQGSLPGGNFQDGGRFWYAGTTDPKGKVGFEMAEVKGTASEAAFASFETTANDVDATFRTKTWFQAPLGTVPISVNVMWDKGTVKAPIVSPQDSWVELLITDASSNVMFRSRLSAPGQTAMQERATLKGRMNTIYLTAYNAQLVVHHSSKAKIAYTTWIDDLVIGTADWRVYHRGCKGTGGKVPYISASGQPVLGSSILVSLTKSPQNAPGMLAIGNSKDSYRNLKLPYDFGGGCLLSQDLVVTLAITTWPTGGYGTRFPIPNDSAYRGLTVYFQFACVDPASASRLGLTTTAGLQMTVK